jgi:hypothetical protein
MLNTVQKSPNSLCYDALLTTLWILDPLLHWSLDPVQDRKRLDPG